jgi:hypothetical protein
VNGFLQGHEKVFDELLRSGSAQTQAVLERSETGIGTVRGTLNTYGQRNDNGYLHVPGSATASLAARKQAGRSLTMGYQHHWNTPLTVIGKWDNWQDSRLGIHGSGPISDVTAGRDAATLLEDKAIDGISIGFRPVEDPDSETVQLLAPGQTGVWETPYGQFVYTAEDWTIAFSLTDVCEASIVHEPADGNARVDQMLQSTMELASRAMPGLLQADSWEDVAYSMALLLGGRGAAAFADLPTLQHFALYQRLAGAYKQHGVTPPAYQRQPDYQAVEFANDERTIFADRFLRKTAATLTATARGIQGPLSQETRDVVDQARTALDAVVQTRGIADELRQLAEQTRAALPTPKENETDE